MSAICGVFGKASSPEDQHIAIGRMTESMKLIGPDSKNVKTIGTITLAHQALLVTPEERSDTQPLTLSDEGFTIVFDGRIYNRDEVYETLKSRPSKDASDALLMLRLYQQIGKAAFYKANAEFALAILDQRKKELVLARDPVGNRALYYADTPSFLAFASSSDALAALPEVPSGIDPITLAAYFTFAIDLAHGRSVHKAIKNVPPAHTAIKTPSGLAIQRYYSFTNKLETRKTSLPDAIDGIRYEIIRSVEDRMRSSHFTGTTLSGGIDSSGITTVAARHLKSTGRRLQAFSARPSRARDPLSREEIQHVDTVAQQTSNLDLNLILSDQTGPFSGLKQHILEEDFHLGPFYYIEQAIAIAARNRNIRTILTGLGGDMLVSQTGKGTFLRQLFNRSGMRSMPHLKNSLRKSRSFKGFIAQELVIPFFPEFLGKCLMGQNAIGKSVENTILRTDFLAENDITTRLADKTLYANRLFKSNHAKMAYVLDVGWPTYIPEQWGRKMQVEFLHPYADLRLIEFCLSLPPEYFAYGPQKRGLYREAMTDMIPDSVRMRSSKGAFIPLFHRSIRNEHATINDTVRDLGSSHMIWSIIDFTQFDQILKSVLADPNDYQLTNWDIRAQTSVFSTIALALFLTHKV